jgi:hypothetical protein
LGLTYQKLRLSGECSTKSEKSDPDSTGDAERDDVFTPLRTPGTGVTAAERSDEGDREGDLPRVW